MSVDDRLGQEALALSGHHFGDLFEQIGIVAGQAIGLGQQRYGIDDREFFGGDPAQHQRRAIGGGEHDVGLLQHTRRDDQADRVCLLAGMRHQIAHQRGHGDTLFDRGFGLLDLGHFLRGCGMSCRAEDKRDGDQTGEGNTHRLVGSSALHGHRMAIGARACHGRKLTAHFPLLPANQAYWRSASLRAGRANSIRLIALATASMRLRPV